MIEDSSTYNNDNDPMMTASDLAMVLIRVTSIWFLYSFIYFAVQAFPQLLWMLGSMLENGDFLEGGWVGFVKFSASIWLGFFVNIGAWFILWRKADRIAIKITGSASDRAVQAPITKTGCLRIGFVLTGIWYAVPQVVNVVVYIGIRIQELVIPAESEDEFVAQTYRWKTSLDSMEMFWYTLATLILSGLLIMKSKQLASRLGAG